MWMNFICIKVNKRSQPQKAAIYMMSWKIPPNCRHRRWIDDCQRLGEEGTITIEQNGGIFWVHRIFLYFYFGSGYMTICKTPRTILHERVWILLHNIYLNKNNWYKENLRKKQCNLHRIKFQPRWCSLEVS